MDDLERRTRIMVAAIQVSGGDVEKAIAIADKANEHITGSVERRRLDTVPYASFGEDTSHGFGRPRPGRGSHGF